MRPVSSPKASLSIGEHDISSSFSFSRLAVEEEEEDDLVQKENGEHEHTEHSFLVQSEEGVAEDKEEGLGDESHMTSATAEQIMVLIDQLEMTTSGLNRHIAPCTCCTGELVVV